MLRKYLDRQYIGFVISLIALSTVIFIFRDIFLFTKGSVSFPAWMSSSISFYSPKLFTFLCLLPAAFIPKITSKSIILFLKVIAIAPMPTFILLSIDALPHYNGGFQNFLIGFGLSYLFVVVWDLLAPAIILVILRIAITILQTRKIWWTWIQDAYNNDGK